MMNATVKTLTHRSIAFWSFRIELSRTHWCAVSMLMAVIISAFTLVYQQDLNRRLMSQVGTLQTTEQQLRNEWSQLLLQKSALSGQMRVAQIAKQDLHMQLPQVKEVRIITTSP